MKKQILDGCTAAAHGAFALSDVATVYPITPIAAMGDTAMRWGLEGRRNLMGQPLEVREMESELGAAGAVHGAAAAGALATTFTASQGLMLMIPNMYKIAGELLPVVFHVGCRSLATHALSIFGDHQDVMACRATGFTMLASASVQETMDLGAVAHLAAIEGSLPVLHFFDGWRTSSELDTIDVIDYESLRPLVDWNKVTAFRHRSMNPQHPDLRGSAQNPDVYFQNREAVNSYYDAFGGIVQRAMDKIASVTGRQYHLVDYSGAPDADRVIVVIGSAAEVASETAEYLNASTEGYKVGVITVRLYRPFPTEQFLAALPATVRTVAVLDRTKEPGAQHEPLCQDVMTALYNAPERRDVCVIGGRYGLSSKEFNPSMVKAIYDEMAKESPKNPFTVGINDDVTHLSLDITETVETKVAQSTYQTIFYGIGNDGTVGGTKMLATMLGNTPGLDAQAYFNYSAKKSGGYTISQLRIGHAPVTSAYEISDADYVACHKTSYVNRFDMVSKCREGGVFVLNSPWTSEQLATKLPVAMRRAIAAKKLTLYNIDADTIAAQCGLGPRINTIMDTVWLSLSGIVDYADALAEFKKSIAATYRHEVGTVVERNFKAVDMTLEALKKIDYNAIDGWTDEPAAAPDRKVSYPSEAVEQFILKVHTPCIHGRGDAIPVSALAPDGVMPMGTTAYEHRRIATRVPVWDATKCVECTECSLVCPHAAIRPFVLSPDEAAKAPEGFAMKDAYGMPTGYKFHIQNYPEDCLGCSSCSIICPGHALTMTPVDEVLDREVPMVDWAVANVSSKTGLLPRPTVKGSQMHRPGLQFSGACAGCGETPYVKLLTQLFGERLIIANATGCSSIWGANFPSNAYCCTDGKRGPAWGNSLFEDNGEYGYGMLVAIEHQRRRVALQAKALADDPATPPYVKEALEAWLAAKDDPELSEQTGRMLSSILTGVKDQSPAFAALLDAADMFGKKSVWAVGGDGWAYDIGFAGLDHVLASGEPIKVLVMDTECYSNTGGQMSKATPRSAVAKYAPDGKRVAKKELGRMMMTYGNVYVASIALGANYQQAIDAIMEAERYPGPAIVIAYCPCLMHGIQPGLGHSVVEQRRAVESGYWPLYRFRPEQYAQGESGLTIDSPTPGPDNSGTNGSSPLTASPRFNNPEPVKTVAEYTADEDRYADLNIADPTRAGILRPELQKDCNRTLSALNYRSRKP
ncbi:MAG: pyruvate:ferredoxin (flavodoxin) oxidoreductase [Muribaculaceae bacterium]|nr:pyruvate:ferredoxin (flavodoxin) oxidoreductase [Muribaculaceae bacterium]